MCSINRNKGTSIIGILRAAEGCQHINMFDQGGIWFLLPSFFGKGEMDGLVAKLCPDPESFGAGPVYLTSRETGSRGTARAGRTRTGEARRTYGSEGGQELRSLLGALKHHPQQIGRFFEHFAKNSCLKVSLQIAFGCWAHSPS